MACGNELGDTSNHPLLAIRELQLIRKLVAVPLPVKIQPAMGRGLNSHKTECGAGRYLIRLVERTLYASKCRRGVVW
ncbi:MAG: hypothetical protein WBE37_08645 [Bryobacteraceae bacterium]